MLMCVRRYVGHPEGVYCLKAECGEDAVEDVGGGTLGSKYVTWNGSRL